MYTIDKQYTATQIIKKSEFICNIFPIKNLDDAQNILQSIRKQYHDATHNCYAMIYGESGEYARSSDDGEPSQTAGVVILDALKKNDLTNVLAVVTRYFGGIKLGAGGLVRAYSSSVGLVCKDLVLLKLQKCANVTFTFSYSYYNYIEKYLSKFEQISKDFQANITLEYLIPSEDIDEAVKRCQEITKNQIQISIGEEITKSK